VNKKNDNLRVQLLNIYFLRKWRKEKD